MDSNHVTGWGKFRLLLTGQALSLLGTGMTRFAMLVWAYQKEGTATSLALLGFFACITYVLASPFAGVLVDRWDRRKVMIIGDAGAGLMTILMLILYFTGNLQVWHLYITEGLVGAFEAFQEPAFSAAVTLLVPKTGYTRANGLLGLGRSAARVFSPALGGLLQQTAGLGSVMIADLVTMSLAVMTLLFLRIPKAAQSLDGFRAAGSFQKELRFGISYIVQRPGLSGILLIFFLINLFATLTYFAVLSPMILARTSGDEMVLGTVRTVMGIGGIAGGVLISIWGGPRRKARAFLLSTSLSFLICDFLMAISRSGAGWSIAGFVSEMTIPFIVSPYYAIWQEVVPADVQGRVFSTREMIQVMSQPLGYLFGGILADRFFEPALQVGGALTGTFGRLVGTGPGAGMAAMFLCTGLFGALTGLLGFFIPAIRRLDISGEVVDQGRMEIGDLQRGTRVTESE